MKKAEEILDQLAVRLPVDGTLDLHTFKPCDVADVVVDYLEECRRQGILQIRLIHGKGIGNLRRTVEATLGKLDFIENWKPAGHDAGHWGATLVWLKP